MAHMDPSAPPIWTEIALLGFWLICPGMWGAILSSAVGSALGGLRVLQALANDGLAPRAMARLSRTGQPTIATWATGAIAQASGIAGLRSNTLMFGWPSKTTGLERILRVMRGTSQLNISTVIAQLMRPEGPEFRERIDVWWGGLENNGDLMLLLSHLLTLHPAWRSATIRIRTIVDHRDHIADFESKLNQLLTDVRIKAEPAILVKEPRKTVPEIMHAASRAADLVVLGIMQPEEGREREYAERLNEFVSCFTNVILVRNAAPYAGELI